MRLIHYSHRPLPLLSTMTRHEPSDIDPTYKPIGLWVSDDDCEDNWPKYVRRDNPKPANCLDYAHEVTLKPTADVLFLTSIAEVHLFNFNFSDYRHKHWIGRIQWPRVMQSYEGIIITPYQWDCRLQYGWYYPWDCASGCIWEPSAIESIELVNQCAISTS